LRSSSKRFNINIGSKNTREGITSVKNINKIILDDFSIIILFEKLYRIIGLKITNNIFRKIKALSPVLKENAS
tara:strand:- start:620 stop:838 length:219 start_codon:yes stop_codon:yes gene_type:complete